MNVREVYLLKAEREVLLNLFTQQMSEVEMLRLHCYTSQVRAAQCVHE